MDMLQTIRDYVVENFLFGDGSNLDEKTSLFRGGILDSTGILELTTFVEETFGITIEDHELIPENMDSIASLVAFIARKQAAGARAA